MLREALHVKYLRWLRGSCFLLKSSFLQFLLQFIVLRWSLERLAWMDHSMVTSSEQVENMITSELWQFVVGPVALSSLERPWWQYLLLGADEEHWLYNVEGSYYLAGYRHWSTFTFFDLNHNYVLSMFVVGGLFQLGRYVCDSEEWMINHNKVASFVFWIATMMMWSSKVWHYYSS